MLISGKGGTGKTSLTASFAALAHNAVIADCDVDAANLHFLLKPRVQKTIPFSGGKVAEIDPVFCIGCGECVNVCRYAAIAETADGKYAVNSLECEGCGVCVPFCPTDGIKFEPAQTGEIYQSDTKYGPLVHARLGVAQENSGKLVAMVRKKAREIAGDLNIDLLLVDGAPGVGCPVISSITGADAVLIVAEPTVSGLHDMERVIDLARYFSIPAYLCINKYDINPEITAQLKKIALERNVELLGAIIFDPIITEAQVAGMPVVEFSNNGISTTISSIWGLLSERIR